MPFLPDHPPPTGGLTPPGAFCTFCISLKLHKLVLATFTEHVFYPFIVHFWFDFSIKMNLNWISEFRSFLKKNKQKHTFFCLLHLLLVTASPHSWIVVTRQMENYLQTITCRFITNLQKNCTRVSRRASCSSAMQSAVEETRWPPLKFPLATKPVYQIWSIFIPSRTFKTDSNWGIWLRVNTAVDGVYRLRTKELASGLLLFFSVSLRFFSYIFK